MIYVEWLRARKRLAIFAIVLVVLVFGLGVLPIELGRFHSSPNGGFSLGWTSDMTSNDMPARTFIHDALQRMTIPLDSFLMTAAVIAFVFTISLYTSLYAQRESLHVAFTKPLSRTRLALNFFAVDLGSIAAMYAFVVVLGLLAIAVFGGLNRIVAPHPAAIVPLGGILLLYGLMQASTAWLRRGAGGIAAALWVAFFVVPSLMNTPIAQVNAVMRALWHLDPTRYLAMDTNHGVYTSGSNVAYGNQMMWGLDGTYGATALLAFSLGIAACAIAIISWNRVEV